MTFKSKVSLLCMSVLTLNFISGDLYSMNDSNNFNYFYPQINMGYNNYNRCVKNDGKEYNNMLEPYKYKKITNKKNNYNVYNFNYDDDAYSTDFEDYFNQDFYYNKEFLSELKQNLDEINDVTKKEEFKNRVVNILKKFGINNKYITKELANDEKDNIFKLHYKNKLYEDNVNTSLSNAILNDFINNKKLDRKSFVNKVFRIANENNDFAMFVMKCIILDLNINEKFELLWNICDKCDRYIKNKKMNEYNYLMNLIQTLSCMVSYEINNSENTGSNDKIVSDLLQLMISYYKKQQYSVDNNNIKNTINNNIAKYINNMKGKNNDHLLKTNPSRSFLLFIKDSIFSECDLLNRGNEDSDDKESVVSLNIGNYNDKLVYKNNSGQNKYKLNILSEPLLNKVEKLRNMVMVNHAILNNKKTFNQKIPSFSTEYDNYEITSDNMVLFTKHIQRLLNNRYFDFQLYKQAYDNILWRENEQEYVALKKILGNNQSVITNVINLALTPDNDRNTGMTIKNLQNLFIKNAPENMKFYSKEEEQKEQVDLNIEYNDYTDLFKLFTYNKEDIKFKFLNEYKEYKYDYMWNFNSLYEKLQCKQNGIGCVTNEKRKNIIDKAFEKLFGNENNQLISEFTSHLSTVDYNRIIICLLNGGFFSREKVYDHSGIEKNLIECIDDIARNKIENGTFLLQRILDYYSFEDKFRNKIVGMYGTGTFTKFRYIMEEFRILLNKGIRHNFQQARKVQERNYNKTLKNILKLFNSLNSTSLQSGLLFKDREIGRFYKNMESQYSIAANSESGKEIFSYVEDIVGISPVNNMIVNTEKKEEIDTNHKIINLKLLAKKILSHINTSNDLNTSNGGYIIINRLNYYDNVETKSDLIQEIKKNLGNQEIYGELTKNRMSNFNLFNSVKECVLSLNISEISNEIISAVRSTSKESYVIAKEKISKFIQQYNKRILNIYRQDIRNYNNEMLNMFIHPNQICIDLFLEFMKEQGENNCRKILEKMNGIDFISIFKGIIKNKIKSNEKIYQISTSDFIKYVINAKIMNEYLRQNEFNNETIVKKILENLIESVRRSINYDANTHEYKSNLLFAFLDKNSHLNKKDYMNSINITVDENMLIKAYEEEINKLAIELKNPPMQTMHIEFEDFSDKNDYYDNVEYNRYYYNNDSVNNNNVRSINNSGNVRNINNNNNNVVNNPNNNRRNNNNVVNNSNNRRTHNNNILNNNNNDNTSNVDMLRHGLRGASRHDQDIVQRIQRAENVSVHHQQSATDVISA